MRPGEVLVKGSRADEENILFVIHELFTVKIHQ